MKRAYLFITTAVCFLALPGLAAASIMNVRLKPQTVAAFDRYVQATEARIDAELKRPGEFLYVDGLPEPQRDQILRQLISGQIYMAPLTTRDASGEKMTAPDALIHHWLGAVFIPGASLAEVISVVQDYDHHQDWYRPEVIRSRLVSHEGNDFKIYYRLRKQKVITVTLDTDHDVHYFPVDATHEYSRSVSTRIQEVANAGEKDEHEKPVGNDGGFLWRLDSWWRFEERDRGVYAGGEAVSLTPDIPPGPAWLGKPFVTRHPPATLQDTQRATRAAGLEESGGKKQARHSNSTGSRRTGARRPGR